MTQLFILLAMVFAQTHAFADEFRYTCKSAENKPIFKVGESKSLYVEFNGGYLSIGNDTGIYNNLKYVSRASDIYTYETIAPVDRLQTPDLVAEAEKALVVGQATGQMQLTRKMKDEGDNLTQTYKCEIIDR